MPLRAIALAFCLLLPASAAHAKMHALIVGIDTYTNHRNLLGAANDARDLGAVVKKHATGEFKMLLNTEATRASVLGALDAMLAKAAGGDVILFSFSGHGVSDTDDDKYKDEEDGKDEFMLMHGFAEQGPNFEEKIRDDELFERFKLAEQRNVTLFMVADACHSGGFMRSVGDSSLRDGLPSRNMEFKTRPSKPAPVPPGFKPQPEIAGTTIFLSATHESRALHEVMIDGKARGALSYFVARALDGAADLNQDGIISAGEMKQYVLPNVVELSRNQQLPDLVARDLNTALVVRQGARPVQAQTLAALPEISLFVRNNTGQLPAIEGAKLVNAAAGAELIWDGAEKRLYNGEGDVLASRLDAQNLIFGVGAGRVRLGLMERMKQGNVLALELLPDDRLHSKGCQITFRAAKFRYRHFTILNMTYDGTIQFLYPLATMNDPVRWDSNQPWQESLVVTEPFGSDFVVFIASEKPLAALHSRLLALHGRRDAVGLYKALNDALGSGGYELGVKSTFTAEKGQPC